VARRLRSHVPTTRHCRKATKRRVRVPFGRARPRLGVAEHIQCGHCETGARRKQTGVRCVSHDISSAKAWFDPGRAYLRLRDHRQETGSLQTAAPGKASPTTSACDNAHVAAAARAMHMPVDLQTA
jgi:hypothetical protein